LAFFEIIRDTILPEKPYFQPKNKEKGGRKSSKKAGKSGRENQYSPANNTEHGLISTSCPFELAQKNTGLL